MHSTSICHVTSLTSSAKFHPLQLHLVFSWTEATSKTSLHSPSIHSSKFNKLLPTPLTDKKTAKNHPSIITLHTLAHPLLLPSLTLHLWTVLGIQQQEFHQETPRLQDIIYQLHSTPCIYLPRSATVTTQIFNLPTSFLDIYLKLICS